MIFLGDFAAGATVVVPFTTNDGSGGRVEPSSAYVVADVRIYKNVSATKRSSESGYAIVSPFDSMVGVQWFSADLSDDTDTDFYQAGNDYTVVLYSAKTVDSQSISTIIGQFSIANRFDAVDVVKIGGVAQSATDLKDFADAGYDPITHKVQGVVLTDTSTANSDMRGTDSAATAAKLLAYMQLALRKDFAISQDAATELTAINADEGSGAGDYMNETDALQALRDRGDLAWLTGGAGGATKSYTTTNWTRTIGDDDGGVGSDTISVDGTYFATGEINAGTLLEVDAVFTATVGETAQSLEFWGFYQGGGSHQISVEAQDTVSGLFEPIGTIGLGTIVEHDTFNLSPTHTNPATGVVNIKFVHSAGTGITSHVFNVDKAQVNTSIPSTTIDKMLAYFQLMVRSDAAIETDRSTELDEINTDQGSGAGDYSSQTDAQEAIRDTISALNNFDPANDAVAVVTLVNTTTTNSDMRGTDGANTVVPDVAGTAAGLHGTTDGLIGGLNDFDPANDAVAVVTLVDTVTTNSDMRGTDGANVVVPDVAGTAAGLHATTDGLINALNDFDPANDAVAVVTLVDTVTTNSDMRGTDGANTTKTGFVLAADGLDTITADEITTKPTNFREWLMWVVQRWRRSSLNRVTKVLLVKTEAGATATTQTVSDDGTTQEWEAPS